MVKLWPAGSQLVVGEGLETTLAAATRIPYRGAPLQPAWAAVSSGKLSTFPVLPGVERLIILVDHDANGEGQAAAVRCMRALDPGRTHRRSAHPETGRCRFQRPGHAGARVMNTKNDDNDPFTEEVSDPCPEGRGITLDDFVAFLPTHVYIFTPCREVWTGVSVNARLPKVPVLTKAGKPKRDKNGKPSPCSPPPGSTATARWCR